MSTPVPNQKKIYANLAQQSEKYAQVVNELYESLQKESIQLASIVKYDGIKPFSFDGYPTIKQKFNNAIQKFYSDMYATINIGTTDLWNTSNDNQDKFVKNVLSYYDADPKENRFVSRYFNNNEDALKAFQSRVIDGKFNLSDRIWNAAYTAKSDIQDALSIGLAEGKSAAKLSQEVRSYLNEPDKLYRRVRDKFGNLKLSKNAARYKPGAGQYRSSYKNAMRLTRTETAMAYRKAEHLRWQNLDFVLGYEVKRSHKMFPCDLCDSLQGKYPKDFVFSGWHPQCYDNISEVLTDHGWKLFKDIDIYNDNILSLNPQNRHIEYAEITNYVEYPVNGNMIHFYNKSLDCLVTEDHNMVYINKSDGSIRTCKSLYYTKGKGGFYRGCIYKNEDIKTININGLEIDADLFCEFLGYWLSDGSIIRKSEIVISQKKDYGARREIELCISRIGFDIHGDNNQIIFYSKEICEYLKPLGKSFTKYIPDFIKNASVRQIKIFLDSFIKCDGYIRKSNSFIGNRGNICHPNDERLYYTTSEQMSGDLTELILKIGHRPSFSVIMPRVTIKKDGSEIHSRNKCYVIRECKSVTATVFNKEIVNYCGNVYDLELSRNHIMYIRRNGKCFWGSNCMCYTVPILMNYNDFWDTMDGNNIDESKYISDTPSGFNKWVIGNKDRIEKSPPYFIIDNKKLIQS